MFSFVKRPSVIRTTLCLSLWVGAAGCGVPEEGAGEEVVSGGQEEGQVSAMAWTGWTSEEYPPLECNTSQLVNGVECIGKYCDNVRLDCLPVSGTFISSGWTSYFSEEGTNYRFCGSNQWVTGIACRGQYCDDVSLKCTEVYGRTVGSCTWSTQSYSEENGPFHAPAGYYVRGVRCTGSYCDNLSFYYCKLQ